MPENDKPYRIREFGTFFHGKMESKPPGYVKLPPRVFDLLVDFIHSNTEEDDTETTPDHIFSITDRKRQKVIKAKNYVGVVTLKDGTSIEILPKLEQVDDRKALEIFREMLGTVLNVSFRTLGSSSLADDTVRTLDLFIRAFLDEVTILVKRGLKRGYQTGESNEPFLKGKLVFRDHFRENFGRRDRFTVERDEFQLNTPENRLIRSALRYVYSISHDSQNQMDCVRLLASFEEVEDSRNSDLDFQLCATGRNMTEYDSVMRWCRLFLNRRSLNVFKGNFFAFAVFFPMERLYEAYVAEKLRSALPDENIEVSAQDTSQSLLDKDSFPLRPDVVVRDLQTHACVVLDTKWKKIKEDKQGELDGISQGDMYQMFAYAKRFQAAKVILVYPLRSEIRSDKVASWETDTRAPVPVRIDAMFFDLLNTDDSVTRLVNRILGALRPEAMIQSP